jgi:hypothetical protein
METLITIGVWTTVAAIAFFSYFIPAIVADRRGHRQTVPLFIVNLFFGWTLLGWVGCLAWSFAETK